MRANRKRKRTHGSLATRQCNDRICPQCQQPFPFHDYDVWAYKQVYHGRLLFYCSWRCLQEARAAGTAAKVGAPRSDPERDMEIYRLHESGLTYQQVADRVGCSKSEACRANHRVLDRMAAEAAQREVQAI